MESWIIVVIVVGVLLFLGAFYGVFVPKLVKMNRRQKQEKHMQKIEKKQVEVEPEIKKKNADFEIEKQRAEMSPSFCRYCGAKHDSKAKNCTNCGASL